LADQWKGVSRRGMCAHRLTPIDRANRLTKEDVSAMAGKRENGKCVDAI